MNAPIASSILSADLLTSGDAVRVLEVFAETLREDDIRWIVLQVTGEPLDVPP